MYPLFIGGSSNFLCAVVEVHRGGSASSSSLLNTIEGLLSGHPGPQRSSHSCDPEEVEGCASKGRDGFYGSGSVFICD